MKLDWNGDAATAAIRKRLAGNLAAAAGVVLDAAREKIGTPGPPRSRPGEAPRVDTGALRASLFAEVDANGLRAVVGSTEEHAVFTEFGTARMAARPWFTPAILESADDAARELAR